MFKEAIEKGHKSRNVLESECKKTEVQKVAKARAHLSAEQREELSQSLQKCDESFSGELGKCPHEKVHLQLKEKAEPHRLVQSGVLERTGRTEWMARSFVMSKKRQPSVMDKQFPWAQ